MKIEELEKLIDQEIQWLRYYGHIDSRQALNEKSEIYRDLISIGYTKRIIPLDRRCCPCIITSDEIICEGFDIDKLITDSNLRGENRYSPIEAYTKIFPDKKMEIFNRLK
jgi:hypothetical protein